MNKTKILVITILFFTILYSCKKPNEIQDLHPSKIRIEPFFPCYPKSYWNYADSLGNSSTLKVDNEYIEYSIKTADNITNEPYLLPRINGDYFYLGKKIIRVKGAMEYYHPTSEFDIFEPVVLFYGDDMFNTTVVFKNWRQQQSYIKEIDEIFVNGTMFDTVIVNKIIFNDPNKPDPILRYFSKNVGLILEQVIYHQDSIPDTVTVKSLTGYQIFKN